MEAYECMDFQGLKSLLNKSLMGLTCFSEPIFSNESMLLCENSDTLYMVTAPSTMQPCAVKLMTGASSSGEN